MSDTDYQQLLQAVQRFLQQEKEVYGPFHLPDAKEKRDSHEASATTPDMATTEERAPSETTEKKTAPTPVTDTVVAPDPRKTTGSDQIQPEHAQSLEELRILCQNADILRTDLEHTNLVFGTGNPEARVMFIGEAPGAQEDKQGEPFVGRAGQLLNKILEAISFRREDVYIANILKHRPPKNRDPLPEERQRSLPYLYQQIHLIRPWFIVCLGRISAQTLLQTDRPMKELRGNFYPFRDGIELMVTFHPAALLRNPSWKRDTWEDVQMLRNKYDERSA